MALSDTKTKEVYDGNGATVLWPITFAYNKAAINIAVYLTDPGGNTTLLTSDYWVDTENDRVKYPGYESGTEPPVSMQPPTLPAGWKLTVKRSTPLTQLLDLLNKGDFNADELEAALDKLTMIAQEADEATNRALKGDVTTTSSLVIPAPAEGSILGWLGGKLANLSGIPSLFSAADIQACIDHLSKFIGAHSASAISYGGNNVGTALDEVENTLADLVELKAPKFNLWTPTKEYAVGDIVFTPNATSYKRMECVVAGITGATEPIWTDVGTLVTDGAVTWIVDDVRDGSRPGDVIQTYASTLRPGTMLADGSAVSRTVYRRLFAAIGTTYGVGDGATTFNLPNHRDRMALAKGVTYPTLGSKGGANTVTLTTAQIPWHDHAEQIPVAGSGSPYGKALQTESFKPVIDSGTWRTGGAGGGGAHENMPPYLTVLVCIKY